MSHCDASARLKSNGVPGPIRDASRAFVLGIAMGNPVSYAIQAADLGLMVF